MWYIFLTKHTIVSFPEVMLMHLHQNYSIVHDIKLYSRVSENNLS